MTRTLLLDLDDTLLDTNLSTFVPAYFQALSDHLKERVAPEKMIRALLLGMNRMVENDDPTQTLQDAFDSLFYGNLDRTREDLAEAIEDFYDHAFPQLASLTRQRAEAASLIEWANRCGIRVAIATDPLFPHKATLHRLRWAGIDPDQVELISTYEHFHFTKTHPAYYAEVLGRLGWPEGPVLMVGNDLERDLLPAQRLGLATYWIDADPVVGPGLEKGRGTLANLRPWLESVNWSTLEPSFHTAESILAILTSTPAVLHSMTNSLTEEQWHHEPTREDWAMNEIVCHLRDTEREIHQMQTQLLLEREGAFIPRPDTGIWANEREYRNVHGPSVLAEFTAARLELIRTLKVQEEMIWSRKARHAIFGPTDFREVVSFIGDHDRLHIQQAWKTLRSL